jgi:hypothetical protein
MADIYALYTGGFYNTHIPVWFKWIRYMSYLTYTLNGLAKMEFAYGSPMMYVYGGITVIEIRFSTSVDICSSCSIISYLRSRFKGNETSSCQLEV